MKYKLLLFDADGTLFDYDKAEEFALKEALCSFGLNIYNPDILQEYRKVNFSIWKEFENNLISAGELKTERFKRFFKIIKIDGKVSPKEFSDVYLSKLSEATFLLPGAEKIVEWCSSRFKIAIITNGLTIVQRPRFNSSSLSKYFFEYIISEEVGHAKPGNEIFDYSFTLLDHSNKDDVLIIGDNLSSDIKGGIDYGIDTCWLNQDGNNNDLKIHPTFEISDLSELKNILIN